MDTGSRSDADFQKSNRTSIQARAVAIVESRLKTMTEKLQSFDRGATLKMGRIKATREGEPRLLLESAFLGVR